MTTAAPKPRLSGFCNPTLPRTDAYDPHQRCHGCDCRAPRCPCNPETVMTEITPDPDLAAAARAAAARGEQGRVDALPVTDENPMTPEDHVDWLGATAELLDEALAGYSPEDWTDAVRLLHALRKPIETLRRIDSNLSTWVYLHGEHGLHQQIEGIPGRVNVTRGRSKEKWAGKEAATAYVEAQITAIEGELPDPLQVVEWVTDVASIGYCRKGKLREAGLDVDDFYESLPGTISVSIG